MIYLGMNRYEKSRVAESYIREHGIEHVVLLSHAGLEFPVECGKLMRVDWPEAIMYRTFYPLLQEINGNTLVVVNEFMRSQNRYELTYNCVRNYLNQTNHQLIFQDLPFIDDREDFMILFDFATKSRWKRKSYEINLILDNVSVVAKEHCVRFVKVPVETTDATKDKYKREKDRRFVALGKRDPHTIPRNLYLIGGKDKAAHVEAVGEDMVWASRNARIKHPQIVPYSQEFPGSVGIFEFPHRFIDLTDFMTKIERYEFPTLTADLNVDEWYYERFDNWRKRIGDFYADLRR